MIYSAHTRHPPCEQLTAALFSGFSLPAVFRAFRSGQSFILSLVGPSDYQRRIWFGHYSHALLFSPTGDSAAHGMTDTQGSPKVLHAMSLVSSKAHEVFPDIPIFPCFGNNDLPGHYILPNSSEWYETVLSYWSPLILCSKCPPNVTKTTSLEKLKKTFLNGGYYSANIASKLLNE